MKKLFCCIFLLIVILLNSDELMLTGNVPGGISIKETVNLAEFLTEEAIFADGVLLAGTDGTAAYIRPDSYEYISIENFDNQWKAVADSLPPVCNIRSLAEIVIWQGIWEKNLIISDADGVDVYYQPFFWILDSYIQIADSQKNGHKAIKYKFNGTPIPYNQGEIVWVKTRNSRTYQVEFDQDKLQFDGYGFFYDGLEVQRIVREK